MLDPELTQCWKIKSIKNDIWLKNKINQVNQANSRQKLWKLLNSINFFNS